MSSIKRVLMVCAGNTCRSAMAEGIARNMLGFAAAVESAGLEAANGMPATEHAQAVMAERGIDIGNHRSRSLDSVDLSKFDLLVAMQPWIAARLRPLGVDADRLRWLNVEDPHGKGLTAYRAAADRIERGLLDLVVEDGGSTAR